LLPLELFKLRRKIERTKKADKGEFLKLSKEIKSDTIKIMNDAMELMDQGKISEEDYSSIEEATSNLLNYFAEHYEDLKLEKEVPEVMGSFYLKGREEGRQEGRQEGLLLAAKKMLIGGLNVELVCNVTDLPKETVEKLKKEIEN
jgi:predicted transposase/invertase (TIGR01784 family)